VVSDYVGKTGEYIENSPETENFADPDCRNNGLIHRCSGRVLCLGFAAPVA